ncbi:MAG TPA: LysR family transcriptional regulator [Polyangiaceae bacterium]|nr:LysR family transcriptional regulator [Polyangiaceae bacterium]
MQEEMRTFVTVVEAGTIASAAKKLLRTPSAISKQLKRLEDELRVTLLHRSTRQLRLTDDGRRFHAHALRLVSGFDDAKAELLHRHTTLSGSLRISAPLSFGQEMVATWVAQFSRHAPEVHVDLNLSDRWVDLTTEPFDVAIRIAPRLPSSGHTAQKLGTMRWHFVASPSYLSQRGTPSVPRDLSDHACLELAHALDRGKWRVAGQRPVAVRGPLVSNGIVALHRAALAGAGIAQLPAYLVSEDVRARRLVRVLPRHEGTPRQVFALFQDGQRAPHRVRAFVDFLRTHAPRDF